MAAAEVGAAVGGVHVLFFFQAEDGMRDATVTGVQTCALPISRSAHRPERWIVLPCRSGQKLQDRKSTRLNSSHGSISYAVFCLNKKKTRQNSSHRNISYAVFCLQPQRLDGD